jgi:hypothetical protein
LVLLATETSSSWPAQRVWTWRRSWARSSTWAT